MNMLPSEFWLKKVKEKPWKTTQVRAVVVILAVLGIALILWPTTPNTAPSPSPAPREQSVLSESGPASTVLEKELSQILSQISGVGAVQAKLTLKSEGTKVYATNERIETRHVFNTQAVSPHILQTKARFNKVLHSMNRADSIHYTRLNMLSYLLDRLYRNLKVTDIIQSIKNAENVNTVIGCPLNKPFHYIIRIMSIAYQGLSPQQHLQPGLGNDRTDCPEPLPGIFIKKANCHIKSGSTPDFQGMIAYIIQFFENRMHIFQGHSGSPKALMSITK
jgi:hypothetical protein